MQWWVSVSFGLLIIAYFAAEKIGSFTLAIILAAYGIFSAWIFSFLFYNVDIILGFMADLEALDNAGGLKSFGARKYMDSQARVYGIYLSYLALAATFFGCAGYLVYTFRNARKANKM